MLGEALQGSLDVCIHQPLEYLLLGAPGRVPCFAGADAPVEIEVLHLAEVDLRWLADLLSVTIDVGVGQDAVEPRLEVGPLLEAVVGPVRLEERLLDEVFGIRWVAGHPERGGVELGANPMASSSKFA